MVMRSAVRVLGELAQIAAETLELQDVFDRVATAVREIVPCDHIVVVRVVGGDRAVAHATTVPCGPTPPRCSEPAPLTDWSERIRPRPGPIRRVDDAPAELDPTFPLDAQILRAGVCSALWQPFRAGEPFAGGVWVSAFRPNAFSAEHEELLAPVAALLGSAVEHWRIWDAERRRRERLGRLEALISSLADSLDVRTVFDKMSQAVKAILPHDLLVLTELDVAARTLSFTAVAGTADVGIPDRPVEMTEEEVGRRLADFEIVNDIPAEVAPTTERQRLLLASGMHSWLRVPVWLGGEVRGSLSFFSREPGCYGRDETELAWRFADRIALTLSHERLAEEARVASEERSRAERLAARVEALTREAAEQTRRQIAGTSPAWRAALGQVGRVASSETSVLITGESGTGKEVLAHLVHHGSARAGGPFVAINCAALPEQLLESELFGHEKGAFTGAVAAKAGRLEQAAGGTLFLDEIAEMSPAVQAKLLRVLEERVFCRLGGTRTIRADVRLIAATNRDLADAIGSGEFREDLYYRINVFRIHIPPLRERPEDILPLAELFLNELGRSMGRPAAGISRDARAWLLEHPWPGNARELKNAIERAILLCDGGLITREHLPPLGGRPASGDGERNLLDPAVPLPAGGVDLEAVEQSFVERALRESRGNKSRAARMLGLTRAQLYTRLERYGLN